MIFLKTLLNALSELLTLYNLSITEPLELQSILDRDKRSNCIRGIIEVDSRNILLFILSRNDAIGRKEISPLIIQLYNSRLEDMIICTDTTFEESAINTCRETSKEIRIALCRMEKFADRIEENQNLKDIIMGLFQD
jgi:hypothetical protein